MADKDSSFILHPSSFVLRPNLQYHLEHKKRNEVKNDRKSNNNLIIQDKNR